MTLLKPIWTDTYKVAWHEATTGNRASLVALCNYLQETAWNHAEHLGFGFRTENGFEKAWVIVRLHIEVDRYPAWNDKVTVETWPSGYKGYLAFREFRILNEENVVMARATTTWLLIDTLSRRPCHLEFLDTLDIQVKTLKACGREAPAVKQPDEMQDFGSYRVRYYDLDMYQHVNNTRYIEMLVGAYPGDWFGNKAIKTLSIEFLKESLLGDQVLVKSDGPAAFYNLLAGYETKEEKLLVKAAITWAEQH
ncbi:MAG: acyl-[acyl-carrier-protein] thioesterase [Lentimicrobium sp.]